MTVKEMSSELKGCFSSAVVQDIDDMFGYPEESPRVGEEYQVEITSLPSSLGSGSLYDDSGDFGIGLPIPIMWVSKQRKNGIMEATSYQVTVPNKDESVEHSSSKEGYVNSKYNDIGCGADGCRHTSRLLERQECNCSPVPGHQGELWDVIEQSLFLLGLYIFGKKLTLVKRFVGTKRMGDVLSYYYGSFYRSADYRKWSEGRKANSKRWIHGIKFFTGARLQELVSRLSCYLSEERQIFMIEGSRMVRDDKLTMEEYVFKLKDWVGSDVLVDAIAIGKGKRDLTGTGMEPVKATHSVRVRPDIALGKDFASLSSVEIIEVLTGDYRLSKGRSYDLFFDAVWPRLLGKGWQSVQPKDSFSKLSVVYLPPEIEDFSQGLIRGDEYFDSISDILKKVASDPELLELDEEVVQVKEEPAEGMLYSTKEQEVETLSKEQPRSFLQQPLLRRCDLMKFMVVDTSLASEGERTKVRELRSLPIGRNNTNKFCYSRSERDYSTECITKAASFEDQAYCRTNFAVHELPRDSAQLVGTFGKPGELRNIISDDPSIVTGQPLNVVAPIPQQPTFNVFSKRELRHAIGNISTEEDLTGILESSKERSPTTSAPRRVEVSDANHDGVSDENPYPHTVIDLSIPHASLGSLCEVKSITNDMQSNINLSADRNSDILDISNDPNAPDILSFSSREDQQPIENGRRQSRRNRPSARALEAIAYGFFETKKKRKAMPTDNSNSRQRVQAKSTDQSILNDVRGNVAF